MIRNRVNIECQNCHITFEVIKSRKNTAKYCSRSCHGKKVLASIDPKTIPRATGSKNANWKGGRRKHSNGYQWILVEGSYILEHRHVMQKHIGRKLLRHELVHHINHDKLDNRLENLEIVGWSEHTIMHHKEGLYKPMGWSRLHKRCINCNTLDKPHRAKGLCKTCYKRYERGALSI